MRIEQKFTVAASESTVLSRASSYFAQKGYVQIYSLLKAKTGARTEEMPSLAFKRGSAWKSFLSMNPAKWASTVRLNVIPQGSKNVDILAVFEVDESDNRTAFTDEFWQSEAAELGVALSTSGANMPMFHAMLSSFLSTKPLMSAKNSSVKFPLLYRLSPFFM